MPPQDVSLWNEFENVISEIYRQLGAHKVQQNVNIAGHQIDIYVEELTAEPYEVVVDCSGRPEGLKTSLSLLRPRGTLVLKTTTAAPPDFHTSQLVIDEITVVGSRCGPFAPALRLLALGLVDVEPLIEAVYPLEKGVEALEHAKTPGTLKVLLVMNG